MKKICMLFAALAMTAVSFAQGNVTTGHKAFDNVYVGVNVGATTPLVGSELGGESFKNFSPTVGVRVGKNFTTVLGALIEGKVAFESSPANLNTSTWIDASQVNLLGTVNLMNLFAGYNGQPRLFEVSALYGFGWQHIYGEKKPFITDDVKYNMLTSKVALDLTFNLGKNKEWQLYLEPALNYELAKWAGEGHNVKAVEPSKFQYDSRRATVELNIGFNYKFKCSNGTHNFALGQLRDQAEIDALNAKINDLQATCVKKCDALQSQLNAANKKAADLKKALDECNSRPVQEVVKKEVANLQPTVVFGQGKSTIDKNQMANVSLIATYMKNHPDAKVKICGYASPEGNPEFNQKLSQKRADAVKNALVKTYKISADRLEAVGLGVTDKLFDEVEFNRIATFNDQNK